MSRLRRRVVLGLSAVTVVTLATVMPALADKGWHGKPPTDLPKVPLMVGSGGAVSSVDRDASQIGIDILAKGGNAADAAVATAAAMTVLEPTSNGLGSDAFALIWHEGKLHGLNASGRSHATVKAQIAPLLEPPMPRSLGLDERRISRPSAVVFFSTSGRSSSSRKRE